MTINPIDFDAMTKTILNRLYKLDARPILMSPHTNLTVSWNEATISTHRTHSHLILSYAIDGNPIDESFPITTTSCNFGSHRSWIICKCGSRVATLFLKNNYFRCRTCHDLTYRSKREKLLSPKYASIRYLDQFEKIQNLEEKAKRKTWRKVPTKKQQRIEKLAIRQIQNLNEFNTFETRSRRD